MSRRLVQRSRIALPSLIGGCHSRGCAGRTPLRGAAHAERRWRDLGSAGVLGVAAAVAAGLAGPVAGASAAAAGGAARTSAAGSLRAWGDDLAGELGDGGSVSRSTPAAVLLPAGTLVRAVAAGGRHTLAVTRAGELLAWGYNFDGQLGNGTTTNRLTPARVILPGGVKAAAVAAGSNHSLAVTTTGKVFAWGSNEYGQLGDGTTRDRHRPVAVRLPAGIRVVAVGACYNYSVALTSAGRVLAWGHNRSGQLGDGSRRSSDVPVPVKLPAGVQVTTIAAGGYQTLALTSAGTVLAWGDGGNGQLGDGRMRSSDVPVRVKIPAGVTVTGVGAGSLFSLARTSSGQVLAWGDNAFGQLGNGRTRNSDLPVWARIPARARVTAVSAGGGFGLALTTAGRVLAWGHNVYGQLGNGTTRSSDLPVLVRLPGSLAAVALAAGPTTRHSLAIVRPR